MSEKLDELKQEAKELGISFRDNIGEAKLQEKIDAFYDEESAKNTDTVEVKEETKQEGNSKGSSVTNEELFEKSIDEIKDILVDDPTRMHQVVTRKIDIEARETKVVKITMVDKREAGTATNGYLNNGAMAMDFPLDVWIEMPNALIEMADTAMAVRAKQNPTGHGLIPEYVKKYVVEYKDK